MINWPWVMAVNFGLVSSWDLCHILAHIMRALILELEQSVSDHLYLWVTLLLTNCWTLLRWDQKDKSSLHLRFDRHRNSINSMVYTILVTESPTSKEHILCICLDVQDILLSVITALFQKNSCVNLLG